MAYIVPYYDTLISSTGAFITKEGKVLFLTSNHETFARNFCHYLEENKSKNSFLQKQFELYQAWKRAYIENETICSDFLVLVLQFDKVERILPKQIVTSSLEPHIRLFNYYIMDWNIDCQTPYQYLENKKTFCSVKREEWSIKGQKDREANEEISWIKKKVLLRDRPYFFKQ